MDRYYMKLAMRVAERSRGRCSPNPFVGAVIVNGGKIVAEGNTQPYGYDHAEIVAIKAAGDKCKGSSIYVSMEPCCIYGKTPPCTDAIIKAGIKRVVVGILDPNPLVSGKGIKALQEAGLEVEYGYFAEEITEQLEYYICSVQNRRPFVIWKSALSLDGKYSASDGSSKWISNPASRKHVHKVRSQVDVVLAGIKSVAHDDAMLNARGLRSANQPLRVILDPSLDISLSSKLVASAEDFPAMILYHQADEDKIQALQDKGLQLRRVAGHKDELDLKAVMDVLYEMKLNSVLLETGNRLSEAFWKAKLVDKCMIFYGNMILGGEKSVLRHYDRHNIDRAVKLERIKVKKLQNNILITGYPLL